jgi:hypothetical protein
LIHLLSILFYYLFKMSLNKRKSLTALIKRDICLAKQKTPIPTNKELATAFDISTSTISDILNEKDKWLSINPESSDATRKKKRSLVYEEVDQALTIWTEKAIGAELDITGDILKEKAIHFAQLLDINDFKASEGWLTKFKQRHNIKQYTKQGEAASAPISELPIYREELKNSITNQYQLSDIFNADETGLFWKLEPSKVLSTGPVRSQKKELQYC